MTTGRNDPCPCGSGLKHKQCCLTNPVGQGREGEREAGRRRSAVRLAQVPAAPAGTGPVAADREAALGQCLAQAESLLMERKAETLFKLLDDVLARLHLAVDFTYGDFAARLERDERFALVKGQLCGLRGTNPVRLYVDRMGL